MTEHECNKMNYELAIGNAERITLEVQETLDNLMDLVIPLREEIERTETRQAHWVGSVDTFRNIASLLSHSLDSLQDELSTVRVVVGKMTKEGDAHVGKEV